MHGHMPLEWYEKCQKYHEENYLSWWNAMVEECNSGAYRSHLWMTGPSGYWARFGDVKFAVDLAWWIPGTFEAVTPTLAQDMQTLDFVIFTHEHGDHFMPEQIAVVKDIDTTWIVPWCMEKAFAETGIPKEKCIIVNPGDKFQVSGVEMEAYLGHHHYPDSTKGPESLMYTLKTPEKSFFIPGDVRDFDPKHIPAGKKFDAVMMNLYLHRFNGYAYPFPEYYRGMVEFAAGMNTQKLLVGHLYGFNCGSPDLIWNFMHVGMLEDGVYCLRPDMEVIATKIGRRYAI